MAEVDGVEEMLSVASDANDLLERVRDQEIQNQIDAIERTCAQVLRSWSGSNIGYHAHVYYQGLEPKPPGAVFSSEWGLMDRWPTHRPDPGWDVMDEEFVKNTILAMANNPDLSHLGRLVSDIRSEFEVLQAGTTSILSATLSRQGNDSYLEARLDRADKLEVPHLAGIRQRLLPSGQFFSRDSLAFGQGLRLAPHQWVAAIAIEAKTLEVGIEVLRNIAREAANHMRRIKPVEAKMSKGKTTATVFIGHGRSPIWRELKDFVRDRLRLPFDEFNRVATAGIPTATRLAQMLANTDFAFLVMTAEDEQIDGTVRARENVVHEAGLFQGKLGFGKAIIVLEEGCTEFSNIHGLGQIRFPRGQISACFEEIRAVLEREGIL